MEKIIDFISGLEVNATPEEIEAVQEFSKILVYDYGYPKECIQTHPQFRVKASPSDISYKYPVDIVVFSSAEKKREDAYIVVECKKKNRQDGLEQLKHYLEFSDAYLGVWFNGEEKQYVRKYFKDGKLFFDEKLINIPKYGERLEDIGKFKRKDLQPIHNLKQIFSSMRNYLAGNAVGTTRDEEFVKQIINLILCKLYDERYTKPDEIVTFRAGVDEKHSEVAKRINQRFNEAKLVYKDVLDDTDQISLDDDSIAYAVGELQNYCLQTAQRDVIGDAFEIFVQRALKGGNGQFFTPKNVVKTAIEILDPKTTDKIIDPACGSGGFLVEALKYVHKKIEKIGEEYDWPLEAIDAEKRATINVNIRGIEKDSLLSRVTKAYMVMMGDGKSGIFCEDSLKKPGEWDANTQANIQMGSFDIVVTNPPFGAKIPVKGEAKLKQYPLGYKWNFNKSKKEWVKTANVKDSEAPQVLFIDRCLQLLKEGGRLAIVLPDGMLSNPTDGYIVQHLLNNAELMGLIDMPMSTFLPYTPTKCHLAFFKKTKRPANDYSIFMSYAKTCGHDKRGREIYEDEIALISKYILEGKHLSEKSHLGFSIKKSEIKNNILLPKYYNPDIDKTLSSYMEKGDFILKSIGDLEKEGILSVRRGNEIGSENYGTGEYPFIRTSEISNWEICVDPTHCISEDIFKEYSAKQKLKNEDILVINDGTYLMGRVAMLTEIDLNIVVQSHFRIITILDKKVLSPYVLLALLGLEIVQRQIEAKCFRQGTISTLGNRLLEVVIPIPTDSSYLKQLEDDVRTIVNNKKETRQTAQNYTISDKIENLMGIKNKAKLGNL